MVMSHHVPAAGMVDLHTSSVAVKFEGYAIRWVRNSMGTTRFKTLREGRVRRHRESSKEAGEMQQTEIDNGRRNLVRKSNILGYQSKRMSRHTDVTSR